MKPLTSNLLGIALCSLFFGACDRDASTPAASAVHAVLAVQAGDLALAPVGPSDDGDIMTLDQLAVDDDPALAGSCDPWAQDCASSEKCVAYAAGGSYTWDATKCVSVLEDKGALGSPCVYDGLPTAGHDTCGEGLICWDLDPVTYTGVCRAIAGGSPNAPTCPDPSLVPLSLNGLLDICVPSCDPLAQNCSNTETCVPHFSGTGFMCVIDASGDMGQEWDYCEYINACDPGFLCVIPELSNNCDRNGAGCCVAFCDVTNPGCTDPEETCLPYYNPGTAPPGQENLGVCGCSANCTLEGQGLCGDGVVQQQSGEQCDDGNAVDDDGCTNSCLLPKCGDGVVQQQSGEQCDDGNASNGDGCSGQCELEGQGLCGDGIVDDLEQCDDGNANNNDSCTNSCQHPACGDGVIQQQSGEQCDDGNAQNGDGCSAQCKLEQQGACGDGVKQNGEQCDDGNFTDGDGCSANCTLEGLCGDGVIQQQNGEQCDDGNAVDTDFCTNACLLAACGDGIFQPQTGEQCDDGNQQGGDGCSAQCKIE